MKKNDLYVLGLMSGTSLDGLDIAACRLKETLGIWSFEITAAKTIPYTNRWKSRLASAASLDGQEMTLLSHEAGHYFGREAAHFMDEKKVAIDFISSHGHTVFHQPEKRITLQIGHGASLAVASGLPVVCDFRTTDVARGGQGAPLVPVGDRLLFGEYDVCLNLGGIANLSFDVAGQRRAFDVCPANMALDFLAQKHGKKYDAQGNLAQSGKLHPSLFETLNQLPYYSQQPPKSLGREWFDSIFLPLIDHSNMPVEDLLATCCEHIACQIGKATDGRSGKILITGGGAWNDYLIERIRFYTTIPCVVPDQHIVNFKEALIFALLGALRWRNEVNVWHTVTGASADSCSGCVYFP